jgi:hypothetical protein
MKIAVLLGMSTDSDGIDTLGCAVFSTVELAKAHAQRRRDEADDFDPETMTRDEDNPLVIWKDDIDGGAWAQMEDEELQIRMIEVLTEGRSAYRGR